MSSLPSLSLSLSSFYEYLDKNGTENRILFCMREESQRIKKYQHKDVCAQGTDTRNGHEKNKVSPRVTGVQWDWGRQVYFHNHRFT